MKLEAIFNTKGFGVRSLFRKFFKNPYLISFLDRCLQVLAFVTAGVSKLRR